MDENVLAILPLDESVALGCVKPFHCAFLFHVLPFSTWYCDLSSCNSRQKKWGARLVTRANPHSSIWRKNYKSQMHKHYTQNSPAQPPGSGPRPPVQSDGAVILEETCICSFSASGFTLRPSIRCCSRPEQPPTRSGGPSGPFFVESLPRLPAPPGSRMPNALIPASSSRAGRGRAG